MELIQDFRISSLTNALYVQFMAEVNTCIQEATPEALKIVKCYALFHTAFVNLNAVYKRQVKNNLTASLEEKDQERDNRYRCFFWHVKADLYNADPEIRACAQRIMNKIESYDDLLRLSRRAQSGDMTDMGEALSSEPLSADVEKIGQTTNLGNMITANKEYIELNSERSQDKKKIVVRATKDARAALDEQYHTIVSVINSQIMVNAYLDTDSEEEEEETPGLPEVQTAMTQAEILADFVRQINVIIEEYKTEYNQTVDKKPEEKPGETPETPSEGEGETETPEEPDDRPVVQ